MDQPEAAAAPEQQAAAAVVPAAVVVDAGPRFMTADEIMEQAENPGYVDVPIPEWKKPEDEKPPIIRLREMSADEAFMVATGDSNNLAQKARAIASMVARCAIGPDGERIFNEEQVAKFRRTRYTVYKRLQDALLKLNNMGGDDENEDAEKND